jgi:hypothetical protein
MTPEEVKEWELLTSQRVMDFWEFSSLIKDLQVATRLTGQTPPYTEDDSSATTDNAEVNYKEGDEHNPALRRTSLLEPSTLVLTFSQKIQFTIPASSSASLSATSPRTIVTQPFNTFSKRQQYKSMLLSSDVAALAGLETVYIVDVYAPPSQPSDEGTDVFKGWMSYIIYGAIGAAGVLVLAIALACYCHSSGKATRRRKNDELALQQEAAAAKKAAACGLMPPVGLKPGMDARVQSIIEVGGDDDISTLGDPLGPYDKNWIARRNQSSDERSMNENTVGPSIIHDFDYTKTFGGKFDMTSNSSTADTTNSKSRGSPAQGGPSALGPAHSGDDEYSFDEAFANPSAIKKAHQEGQRIEIQAPAGKLGVVIDTFDNGQPGVNAIRGDSVLKGDLCIGDLLMEFDGQDTSNMTALEVSRMIGARSGNETRRLVFMRYK